MSFSRFNLDYRIASSGANEKLFKGKFMVELTAWGQSYKIYLIIKIAKLVYHFLMQHVILQLDLTTVLL